MTAALGGAQVEKALDDLIQRLSKGDSTAEVRAALIEARRLRNVTLRWAAIPPPPDARREMMTRVMDLVAKAGTAARSQPPPSPSGSGRQAAAEAPPSGPQITVEREPARALSPFGGQPARPALTPSSPAVRPAPPPGEFRSNPDGGMTRPRANGMPAPKPRPPVGELPELDEVAPPRAPPMAPSRKPAVPVTPEPPRASPMPAPVRSLSPGPRPATLAAQGMGAPSRGLTPSPALSPVKSPIPSLKKEPSPLPAALRTSNPAPPPPPRKGTAAGLRPIGGGSSFGEPSPAPSAAVAPRKKAPTLEFEAAAQSPRPPSFEPRPSQPATPRVDPNDALRAMSVSSSPRAPHRAHTIAGIPEANEAFLDALRRHKEPSVEPPSDIDSVRARSNMPTASPPPPSDPPRSSGAPPPLRRGAAKGTLMMGSIGAADALEALRGGRAPVFEGFDEEPESNPPSTKPSNPENLAVLMQSGSAPPPRRPSGTMPAAGGSAPPILAIPAAREGRLDGLSSHVSRPAMTPVNPNAQRKPSSPTRIMGSAPPPSVRPSPMPERPLRTVISPGVTIVRPEAAEWQPHPVSPGVTMKLLFRDPRSGVYTALVRLAPGSMLGKRRHAAAEEMLLVSGIATVGNHEMRAGEYCRAEADTVHETITTTTGCTFFLCGSEHDEFLEE